MSVQTESNYVGAKLNYLILSQVLCLCLYLRKIPVYVFRVNVNVEEQLAVPESHKECLASSSKKNTTVFSSFQTLFEWQFIRIRWIHLQRSLNPPPLLLLPSAPLVASSFGLCADGWGRQTGSRRGFGRAAPLSGPGESIPQPWPRDPGCTAARPGLAALTSQPRETVVQLVHSVQMAAWFNIDRKSMM